MIDGLRRIPVWFLGLGNGTDAVPASSASFMHLCVLDGLSVNRPADSLLQQVKTRQVLLFCLFALQLQLQGEFNAAVL